MCMRMLSNLSFLPQCLERFLARVFILYTLYFLPQCLERFLARVFPPSDTSAPHAEEAGAEGPGSPGPREEPEQLRVRLMADEEVRAALPVY